jgi:pyruvate dehydrogenase E2 component (dihydrolipoamide acetyltransferase)
MANIELTVPDLGGFNDIPVIEVLVNPGDTVKKDDPLVTLESDKATMEVPASSSGTVREIKVKVGDKVSQGSVLVTVEPAAGEAPAPPATEGAIPALRQAQDDNGGERPATNPDSAHPDSAHPESAHPESAHPDSAHPESAHPDSAHPDSAHPESAHPEAATPPNVTLSLSKGEQPSNGRPPVATAPAASANGMPSAPVHASPAIRRFARELGVDLGRVRGTGPNGRITRDDVQGFVKTALVAPGAAAAPRPGAVSGFGLGLPPWPVVDFAKFGPVERVALTRIQKISGPVLARNWVMIPHVTQNDDADVTELEAFRKTINAERKDVKVTMLAFLMKAAVAALKRYPQVNASLDGDELVLKKYYHLGFAADTPNGLLVPVIRDVDRKGIVEIAAETSALAAKARDGKLGPNDISGATFTISSLGSIGGTYFTPIINAPEVAILGACKAETRPVWDGAAFVPRLIQPLSFSYDHRVIDGANAARFTVEIKNALADLRRVLL